MRFPMSVFMTLICDNGGVVKGFKKVRVWVAGDCRGEAPTFKDSVDLWDMLVQEVEIKLFS